MQKSQIGERMLPELSPALQDLSYQVIGCALDVHRAMGPGFLESLYGEALAIALSDRAIGFQRELAVGVEFRGRQVGQHRLDLLVAGRLVVELKAVEHLASIHFAQVRSYLRATRLRAGLLLNFESPTLEVRRILNTEGIDR